MKPFLFVLCVALLPLASCTKSETKAATAIELPKLGIPNTVLFEPNLASSGQPTEEQFAQLPAAGYTTVIGLRPANEPGTGWEEAKAKALGLHYVRLPVSGTPESISEENARALDQALKEAGSAKTLICCSSGNRVGALLALRAHTVQGKTPDEALAYGKKAGLTKAEPVVREKLGLPAGK